jgi:hypothetical protein
VPGQHGGYRKPAHPAPVSGPGRLSRRTDGGPGDKQPMRYIAGGPNYGDGQDMADIQGGAPLAAADTPPPTPLSAPTARPDEPVTAGASFGPGRTPDPTERAPSEPAEGGDHVAAAIRAAFSLYPSAGLARMMDALDRQGR